jgi:hypothetical protein
VFSTHPLQEIILTDVDPIPFLVWWNFRDSSSPSFFLLDDAEAKDHAFTANVNVTGSFHKRAGIAIAFLAEGTKGIAIFRSHFFTP